MPVTPPGDGNLTTVDEQLIKFWIHSAVELLPKQSFGGETPVGGIIMYSGAIADIPSNWSICDGTNNTPNLVNKFVYGTGTESDIGTMGGSADAIIPPHTHNIAEHNHYFTTGNESAPHQHQTVGDNASNVLSNYNHIALTHDSSTANRSYKLFGASDAVKGRTSDNWGHHHHSGTTNGKSLVTDNATGAATTLVGKNIPPFVKLAYIMRIS